jgi:serine/threonine-protein kinase
VRSDPRVTPAATPDPELHHFLPGSMLAGRYRMIERVGRGGMGEVYRAEDLKLGQLVAIKFIRAGREHGGTSLELFLAEVRFARQIGHPNVCRVYDIGEVEGMHFLSMEFVDGEDLASLLRRIGRLPSDKATEIAREICGGLAAIHDRGVLHRDLKPGNVMIDGRGRARITDFGLAALQGGSDPQGMIVGTPAYMAPEVRSGESATVRSDLYSLGLLLFETYTGKPAYDAAAAPELRKSHREFVRRAKETSARELDPAIVRIILRCLDPEPAERPASAIDVAAGLPGGDALAAAIAAGRTPEPELLAAGSRDRAMRPAVGWACAAALVLGLAGVVLLASRTRTVSAVPMGEPPAVVGARARVLLRGLGFPEPRDHASGFRYDVASVERIAAADHSATRWNRLTRSWPPVVLHWYRESPRALDPANAGQSAGYSDPAAVVPGMVGLELDTEGRLRRLEAIPNPAAGPPAGEPAWGALFAAAGLDSSAFASVPPLAVPMGFADRRMAWEGSIPGPPGSPVRVEAAAYGGRPVLFSVAPVWSGAWLVPRPQRDEVGRISAMIRSGLLLVVFMLAAWLARRNLRAGRGDRLGAVRVATALMGLRLAVWLLGGHHTATGFPAQFAAALAWSLYDFAFARIFYLAVEPYVRRLWPRVLMSWVRLIGGQHSDPLVGRDALVGCLLGLALSLSVAAHQAIPIAFGLPPGRPDNVGFVEPSLAGLMGARYQLSALLVLYRSAVVNALGFIVVLVTARLLLRRSWPAFAVAVIVFLSVGMPKGELVALNIAFSLGWALLTLGVMMRFGLLAAVTGLMVHYTLQASALTRDLTAWPGVTSWLGIVLVLGLGGYGFVRAMGGRLPVLEALE